MLACCLCVESGEKVVQLMGTIIEALTKEHNEQTLVDMCKMGTQGQDRLACFVSCLVSSTLHLPMLIVTPGPGGLATQLCATFLTLSRPKTEI